jgi:hypothetical protein
MRVTNMKADKRIKSLPIEMLQILEIIPAGGHLPWWEIHRRVEDVYGSETRPTAFRQELATLQTLGLLRPRGDYEFELAGRRQLRH